VGKYLAAAIVVIVLIIAYPLAMEDTSDPCAAFANRAAALTGLPAGEAGPAGSPNFMMAIVRLLGGSTAEMFAKQRFPNIPPALSCVGLYWQAVLDPESTKAGFRRFFNERSKGAEAGSKVAAAA
jgi:hypothetical protein